MSKLRPVHADEILREDFMKPLGLNPHELAMGLHVPAPRIYEIIREERDVTLDTALRLARFFGTTAEFWLNLQAHYELEVVRDKRQRRINRDVRPFAAKTTVASRAER